jgi:hypothetical protein
MLDIMDKNFVMNSGSYFIIFTAILGFQLSKLLINLLARKLSKHKLARRIGVKVHEESYFKIVWDAGLKLFIECYFDLSMCVLLMVLSFVEQQFDDLFATNDDAMASSLTFIYFVLILVVPVWGYIGINLNFKRLNTQKVKNTYGVFYADNRIDTRPRALYNIFFLLRRFVSVVVLVYGGFWPYMQCAVLLVLSLGNGVYMVVFQPMHTRKMNLIEIFNEATIYICACIMTTFLNVAMPASLRTELGWTLMFFASLNIFVNLCITSIDSVKDTIENRTEKRYQKHARTALRIKLGNRETLLK